MLQHVREVQQLLMDIMIIPIDVLKQLLNVFQLQTYRNTILQLILLGINDHVVNKMEIVLLCVRVLPPDVLLLIYDGGNFVKK